MNTQILLDHEPIADGGIVVRALLRITGQAPDDAERPRLDLALVLDRSGSMHGPPLEYAKEAADLVVRRLAATDVISVVAYDDEVSTLAGRVDGSRKQAVRDAVRDLGPGGSTNLSGGWLRGRELAGLAPRGSDGAGTTIRRVLLLTDGLANVGITEPDTLAGLVAGAAREGVSTSTVGFGPHYDERLLRTLAEAGGGSTYYIESADQAPAVFEAELEGLVSLAAQNVAVTVAPGDGVDVAAVHHRYPSSTGADGALRLELGDLYALEPRALLVELLLGAEAVDDDAGELTCATLTLEGHVILAGGAVEKRTIELPIRVDPSAGPVVEPEVRRELLVQEAAAAREQALEDRRRGAFGDGALKLRSVAEKLAAHAAADPALADEVDDLREMADRFEREQVTDRDEKWMYQRAYSLSQSKLAAMEAVRGERAAERKRRRGEEDPGSG